MLVTRICVSSQDSRTNIFLCESSSFGRLVSIEWDILEWEMIGRRRSANDGHSQGVK